METEVIQVKYIYLDVVGFTYRRTVERQTDIISNLNEIVKSTVNNKLKDGRFIYIPIGDGICIALIGSTPHFDDHIKIAEEIIRRIESIHNPRVSGSRKFHVRIGINENIDNVITDINANQNVCGAGVNFAQRIMSFADDSQILVGQTTYETLHYRDRYARAFRQYTATAKHNVTLPLFQYIGGNIADLNRKEPSQLTISTETNLSKLEAYFIANAIKNNEFILSHRGWAQENYALFLLLWYLAKDDVGISESSRINPHVKRMPETPHNTLDEQYLVFKKLPFWVCIHLYERLQEDSIKHKNYFADTETTVPNEKAITKLKEEWPEIYSKYGLDSIKL